MQRVLGLVAAASVILNVVLIVNLTGRTDGTFRRAETENLTDPQELREAFPFLSPRSFIENPNDRIINFVPLRESLRAYLKNVPDAGFYFEYLPTGVSIGINEKENFVLASLLKVPLVMGVYKALESGSLKQDQLLTIQEHNIDKQFGSLWEKGAGTAITIKEAIRLTLVESDNTAKSLLIDLVGSEAIEEVYNKLDIPLDFETNRPVMTPKNYTSVLRSLYLSSYLPFDDSHEILELLTKTPFNDKIAAAVPASIPVAHKIGVYQNSTPESSIFTDCGIVYIPKRPYVLCVMTKGTEESARVSMRTISKMIYDYVAAY